MRKLILSALLISGLFARDKYIGIEAGLNMSDMRYGADAEAPDGSGMRMGAALAVHYPLGPVIANAGYTQRGMTATDGDLTWALDYLTFGFSSSIYNINEQIFVFGGLSLNYLLSAKAKFSGDMDGMDDQDLENVASLDYGLEFGLDYFFEENMGLRFGYYLGLADINEETTEGYESYNKGIKVSFLYGL